MPVSFLPKTFRDQGRHGFGGGVELIMKLDVSPKRVSFEQYRYLVGEGEAFLVDEKFLDAYRAHNERKARFVPAPGPVPSFACNQRTTIDYRLLTTDYRLPTTVSSR